MPSTGPSGQAAAWSEVLARAADLLLRLEALVPAAPAPVDFSAPAYRWRKRRGAGVLEPVFRIASITLSDLKNIERQKRVIEENTRHFVQRLPANNVLLTGARGTGKSSLIKACLNAFGHEGLRIIEVDKADLVDLPEISHWVADRPERFVIFCDDLSFEEGDASYKALKVALDGSIAEPPENILIYATSNRRHLIPERMRDNLASTHDEDGEIHPSEGIEEKISLSERFGLWVSFYPFRQDEYLSIVAQWLTHFGCDEAGIAAARDDALRWALERGSRSGRVAWQFARDWAGRTVPPAAS